MTMRSGHSEIRSILAVNLRRERLSRGRSQETFADECGLHRTYIGAVERAETNISIDNVERIAKALGIGVWELLRPETAAG